MLRVCIWLERFRCGGILFLQWQGENFAHRQHLKVFHFQPVHCATKNPVSPKIFNRFSKSLPELEDFEGGHLGGKFQVRRCFTFAMARWKHCTSTTFESLPLSTCKLCQKNAISPKVFKRFSKSLPHLETFTGGHLGVKFQVRRYFTFAMARWKFSYRQDLKVCHFQPVHCARKNAISPRVFNRFLKSLAQHGAFEGGGAFGWKVSGAQVFYFCKGQVGALCVHNIWKFATFNLYTVPEKSYISKGIQPIFEIFASVRRFWRWTFGCKVSGAQVFYFFNGKVRTLRIHNIWKFATFHLYTVPGKILYLQGYSNDFRNLRLSSKILRVGILV